MGKIANAIPAKLGDLGDLARLPRPSRNELSSLSQAIDAIPAEQILSSGVACGRVNNPWSRIVRAVAVAALVLGGRASAAEPEAPPHLPRYDIDLTIDSQQHRALLRQRVTWTNTTRTAAIDLVFNFYPHYRVPEGDFFLLAKTLEMLRLQPSLGIERGGRHGVVKEARLLALAGKPCNVLLPYEFDAENPTGLRFPLPKPVEPGQTVTVELVCEFHLPNKQGRLGALEGRDIPHQLPPASGLSRRHRLAARAVRPVAPALVQRGRRLHGRNHACREKETLATPAAVKSQTPLGDGRKRVELQAVRRPRLRDPLPAALQGVHDARRKLPDGKTVPAPLPRVPRTRVLRDRDPEDRRRGDPGLLAVVRAVPVRPQFTIAESFFGWNGNECAGLVMIDERVFGMPHLARGYVEYLVSHETCHQWWYNLVGTNGYAETFMDEGAAVHFTHRLHRPEARQEQRDARMAEGPGRGCRTSTARTTATAACTTPSATARCTPRRRTCRSTATLRPVHRRLRPRVEGVRHDRGPARRGGVPRLHPHAGGEVPLAGAPGRRTYRRELEAYTGRDWGEFFDHWVYGKGLTDWKIESR